MSHRTLLIGPLPPPTGGTRVSFELLINQLRDHYEFDLIGITHHSNRVFNFLLQTITLTRIVVSFFRYDIISLHASKRRVLVWGNILILLAFIKPVKIQLRFFGSSLGMMCDNNRGFRWLLKNAINHCQTLVETKGLVEYCKDLAPTSTNVEWFPNSRTLTSTPVLHKESDSITFVYVGHVREEKGVLLIKEAHDTLIAEGYNFRTLYVGRCFSAELENHLATSVSAKCLGEIPSTSVPQIFTSNSVFVFPTLYKGEGYPGAMLEAMSRGIPLISTNTPFLAELNHDGENGYLHKRKDVDGLASCMRQFLDNPKLIETMGILSFQKAQAFDASYWNGEGFLMTLNKLIETDT